MNSRVDCDVEVSGSDGFESDAELDLLLNLRSQLDEEDRISGVGFDTEETGFLVDEEGMIQCPLCGVDISDLSDEQRLVHTNDCIDKEDAQAQNVSPNNFIHFTSLNFFSPSL